MLCSLAISTAMAEIKLKKPVCQCRMLVGLLIVSVVQGLCCRQYKLKRLAVPTLKGIYP